MTEIENGQSISYPGLHDTFPVASVSSVESASAPIDPEYLRMQSVHEVMCGICKFSNVSTTGTAYVVLSCQHKVHMRCFTKTLSAEKMDDRIGGTKICQHCVELALRGGANNAQNDPDLDFKECVKVMRSKHIVASGGIDTDRIMTNGLHNGILYTIMGDKPPSTGSLWPNPAKIVSIFSSSVNAGEEEDNNEGDDEAISLPIGDELIAYLKAKGRTLDDILNTFKVNLAHLFVAGIRTVDQLKEIGFDAKKHLHNTYRPVMPVFLLADSFGLSWDEHLKDVISPLELSTMKLTKRELHLLGVTATKLIETKQCNKQAILNFRIKPSELMKYLGMEFVHFKILGFTARDFDNEQWSRDKKEHPHIAELVAELTPKKKLK